MVLHALFSEFEHLCVNQGVRLPNSHSICRLNADGIRGNKYTMPGLHGFKILAQQGWVIWFIVRRYVWDSDMPGVLVADEFGVGKSFTLGAAAMICQLQTVKVAMGLPQLILWGNTFEERLVIAQNDYTKFFGKEQK